MSQDVQDEKKPLIDYPTVYTFKVMGRPEDGFAEHVKQLFRRLTGNQLADESVTEQPSKKGNYVSLSVSVYLLSEEQRRNIYTELHRDKRVVYYL